MLPLLLLVLVGTIGLSSAYGPHDENFPVDSFIQCNELNPLYGLPNQPYIKPRPVRILPFRVEYREFGDRPPYNKFSGSYFAPVASPFTSPVSKEFDHVQRRLLLDEIGSEINFQLSSPGAERPFIETGDEAAAGELIPLRINTTSNLMGSIGTVSQPRSDEVRMVLNELGGLTPDEIDDIVGATDTLNQLCRATGSFVRMPKGKFFPEWIYTSFCFDNESCSLPAGMLCEPVVSAESILHIRFLMWDCCWSLEMNPDGSVGWTWECGWIRVWVPILGRCHCGCGVQFQNQEGVEPVYRYEGGPGQQSVLYGDRLATIAPGK